jgi:hypothetical protein
MENILRLDYCCLILQGAVIPLFRQISGLSSQCVQFPSSSPRVVNNFEVELRKELGPSGLASVQEHRSGEVFQILVVRQDTDRVDNRL